MGLFLAVTGPYWFLSAMKRLIWESHHILLTLVDLSNRNWKVLCVA